MLVNGKTQDYLPLSDRALHYGDGAFETIRVKGGQPLLLEQHLQRLRNACARLSIPYPEEILGKEIAQLLPPPTDSCVLKIIISRGSGGRGYAPPATPSPTRILQLHPLPEGYDDKARIGVATMVCRHPISTNSALAGLKHLNRIDQVMASLELKDGMEEGLMCSDTGLLIEGIKSNVFLVADGEVMTPDLTSSGVAGIMRAVLIDLFAEMHMNVAVRQVALSNVATASEVFLCNSVFGIWPVTSIACGAEIWQFNAGKITRAIQAQLRNVF